jgi:hypothetical protein
VRRHHVCQDDFVHTVTRDVFVDFKPLAIEPRSSPRRASSRLTKLVNISIPGFEFVYPVCY